MIIGIDASRAFLARRTGIEEYSYQVIKHLREVIPESEEVILYLRKKIEMGPPGKRFQVRTRLPEVDFSLPPHWKLSGIWAPRFWTQAGLSWAMLRRKPDVLFVPVHTVPFLHPKNTIVTVHGLEYEFCPEAYSWWGRFFLRFFTRYSCRAAARVISVSENTKRDVMRLYGIPEKKIRVIYEGFSKQGKGERDQGLENSFKKDSVLTPATLTPQPYLLFIGRLEERKNLVRIIEAFEILKKKYHIPHALIFLGKPGYNYEKIRRRIRASKESENIREAGYVSEDEKWQLLRKADALVFPSLYEGFGLPILEAQSVDIPVVTSRVSSLPEVGGEGAVYVNPLDSQSIAEGLRKVLLSAGIRDGILEKGRRNAEKFSWSSTASAVGALLLKKEE